MNVPFHRSTFLHEIQKIVCKKGIKYITEKSDINYPHYDRKYPWKHSKNDCLNDLITNPLILPVNFQTTS